MKSCPIGSHFCQNRIKILPNTKLTLESLHKTVNILPKWQNFAKYGHTDAVTYDAR